MVRKSVIAVLWLFALAALLEIADNARHINADLRRAAAPCGGAELREPPGADGRETEPRERRRRELAESIRRNARELADRVEAAGTIHGESLAPKSTHAPAR